MLSRCDSEEMELLAGLARKIWFRRKFEVHGGVFNHPRQVVREAYTSMEDIKRSSEMEEERFAQVSVTPPVSWQTPPSGIVKVNWMQQWMSIMDRLVWESLDKTVVFIPFG